LSFSVINYFNDRIINNRPNRLIVVDLSSSTRIDRTIGDGQIQNSVAQPSHSPRTAAAERSGSKISRRTGDDDDKNTNTSASPQDSTLTSDDAENFPEFQPKEEAKEKAQDVTAQNDVQHSAQPIIFVRPKIFPCF